MPFTENLFEGDPDGCVITVSELDNWIRKTKVAIRERMESNLVKAGTWGSDPEPQIRSGVSGAVIFRNNADTSNNLTIFDTGTIATRGYAGVGLEGPSMIIGDGGGGSGALWIQRDGVLHNVLYVGAAGTIQVGFNANPLFLQVYSSLVGGLPAGGGVLGGLLTVDITNNRFVYYTPSGRYYLAGTPF